MDLTATKKISVIGNSGAGKSTLSQQLRARLGIEVFSIDKIFWLPGWQMRDHESFKSLHDKWLQSESWIIEGVGYWSQVEQRLTESGIVIFVDAPVSLCKERAEKRIKEERLSQNPYITEGCKYSDVVDRQMQTIEYFHDRLRPRLIRILSRLDQEKIMVLRGYSDFNTEHALN